MSKNYKYPFQYLPLLDLKETEKAIKVIKNTFQDLLADLLNLKRVTAPLFVEAGTGINDDLNGREKPISFNIPHMQSTRAEIVQSLAKWKRLMLSQLTIAQGHGIYADMNAIRPDEILDEIHSLYVDQWDWERVISADERNLDFLKTIVRKIYKALKITEQVVSVKHPSIDPILPENIKFIQAEQLLDQYPELTPKERENEICKTYGAVFIIGIGAPLKSGFPHDGRAPDYDDWITSTPEGQGLNGDILIWNPILHRSYELSSMGIRVTKEALLKQLDITGTKERIGLYFHQRLLQDQLPLSVGGGIGQSRLCAFLLRKAHIGEVQVSIWPKEMIEECKKNNIFIL